MTTEDRLNLLAKAVEDIGLSARHSALLLVSHVKIVDLLVVTLKEAHPSLAEELSEKLDLIFQEHRRTLATFDVDSIDPGVQPPLQ